MDSAGTCLILVALVFCSAFFSACETAFTSVNRVRLKAMASAGDRRAAKALALAEDYDRLLSTILIGNNIVNILSTSLATVVFVGFLGDAGVSVSTAVMTLVILMFGEISPKSIAKEHAEALALRFTRPLSWIMKLLTPLNFLSAKWKKLVGKLVRSGKQQAITEAELLTYVEEAESGGSINEHEGDLIRSAIEFDDLTAEDILTPRVDLVAVEAEDGREEIAAKFRACGFSRLPVYRESIDDIVGVLHERDFFLAPEGAPVREMMSTPLFVLPSVRLSALLKLFKRNKSHLAVVMDEYGGVQGIVTMEDILEQLVGEIWDEHDEVVEEFISLPDGGWRVSGAANLEKMLEKFGMDCDYESTTVSGWVAEVLGAFPQEGEAFEEAGLRVIVEKLDGRRVETVRVEFAEAKEEISARA